MTEEWGEGAVMHPEAVAQLRGDHIRELEAELAKLREALEKIATWEGTHPAAIARNALKPTDMADLTSLETTIEGEFYTGSDEDFRGQGI